MSNEIHEKRPYFARYQQKLINMSEFISKSCEGETCRCGKPAVKKIAEVIMWDDPNKVRHELTAYVCQQHFDEVLRPYMSKENPPTNE